MRTGKLPCIKSLRDITFNIRRIDISFCVQFNSICVIFKFSRSLIAAFKLWCCSEAMMGKDPGAGWL